MGACIGSAGPGGSRPVVVRVPVEPVEAAMEADAVDAVSRAGGVVVRGPLFGVATQDAGEGQRWRLVVAVTNGCPQLARGSLNSQLWFRAEDHAKDRAERRALLAAVARLESERVDGLGVAGARYRVVRAEEYGGSGPGGMEGPRPTGPEPPVPDWDRTVKGPAVDDGLVLDPDAPVTPARAVERLALRGLRYTGERFPEDVRADSLRALDTRPDALLLPATFEVVERTANGWKAVSGPHATAHEARQSLDFALTWAWPRMHGLIPRYRPDRRRPHLPGGPRCGDFRRGGGTCGVRRRRHRPAGRARQPAGVPGRRLPDRPAVSCAGAPTDRRARARPTSTARTRSGSTSGSTRTATSCPPAEPRLAHYGGGPVGRAYRPGVVPTTRLKCRVRCDWS
ncbi:DUF5954 family protein [Streptomyces sp. NPDC054838]